MFIVFSERKPSSFINLPSVSATAPIVKVAVAPSIFLIVAEPLEPTIVLPTLIVPELFFNDNKPNVELKLTTVAVTLPLIVTLEFPAKVPVTPVIIQFLNKLTTGGVGDNWWFIPNSTKFKSNTLPISLPKAFNIAPVPEELIVTVGKEVYPPPLSYKNISVISSTSVPDSCTILLPK